MSTQLCCVNTPVKLTALRCLLIKNIGIYQEKNDMRTPKRTLGQLASLPMWGWLWVKQPAAVNKAQIVQGAPKGPRALQWRHNGYNGISNHQRLDCLLNRLFRRRSKKTSKLCEENSPVTGEFPVQRASNTNNVSIWWRHHGMCHTLLHWWVAAGTTSEPDTALSNLVLALSTCQLFWATSWPTVEMDLHSNLKVCEETNGPTVAVVYIS